MNKHLEKKIIQILTSPGMDFREVFTSYTYVPPYSFSMEKYCRPENALRFSSLDMNDIFMASLCDMIMHEGHLPVKSEFINCVLDSSNRDHIGMLTAVLIWIQHPNHDELLDAFSACMFLEPSQIFRLLGWLLEVYGPDVFTREERRTIEAKLVSIAQYDMVGAKHCLFLWRDAERSLVERTDLVKAVVAATRNRLPDIQEAYGTHTL